MKRLRLWNNYFWMKLRRWNQVIKKAVITFIFLSRLLLSLHHARHLDVSFCCKASSTSRDARNKSILVRSCEHRHSRTDRDTCGDTSRHTNRQTERHINTQRHLDVSFCCNTSSTSRDATNKSILVRSCGHRHRRSDTGGHTGRQTQGGNSMFLFAARLLPLHEMPETSRYWSDPEHRHRMQADIWTDRQTDRLVTIAPSTNLWQTDRLTDQVDIERYTTHVYSK